MPPLPADRVYSLARASLDAIAAFYVAESVDVPDRQYVSDGPAVAWDCEQLVVYVERIFPGLADAPQPRAADELEVRSAALQVELVRCSPVIDDENAVEFPSPAVIEANAQLVLGDAVMLGAALRAGFKAGDIGGCHSLVIGEWQGLGPMGAFVGGRLGFTLQLTG